MFNPAQVVTPPVWLQLPSGTRQKLAQVLGISRSGSTQVEQRGVGIVVSDGYTQEDLNHITVALLQEKTGSKETDLFVLLNTLIESFKPKETEVEKIVEEIVQEVTTVVETIIKPKRGRKPFNEKTK